MRSFVSYAAGSALPRPAGLGRVGAASAASGATPNNSARACTPVPDKKELGLIATAVAVSFEAVIRSVKVHSNSVRPAMPDDAANVENNLLLNLRIGTQRGGAVACVGSWSPRHVPTTFGKRGTRLASAPCTGPMIGSAWGIAGGSVEMMVYLNPPGDSGSVISPRVHDTVFSGFRGS